MPPAQITSVKVYKQLKSDNSSHSEVFAFSLVKLVGRIFIEYQFFICCYLYSKINFTASI